MKKLTVIPAIVAALPAVAHEGGPVAHAHPHGMETLVAVLIAATVGAAVWFASRR